MFPLDKLPAKGNYGRPLLKNFQLFFWWLGPLCRKFMIYSAVSKSISEAIICFGTKKVNLKVVI